MKKSLALLGILVAFPALAGPPGGPGGGAVIRETTVYSVAEREVARRQEYLLRAQEAIELGRQALAERDYEVAFAQFKIAADLLPPSPATYDLRDKALEGLCEAGARLAEQRIAEGRIADAEATARLVLEEQYYPECKDAVVILARLEDPEYYNKTITPGFIAKVQDVKKMFLDAEGFYNTGRYDLAFKRYEQILNIDPYNIAARKGQERVNLARTMYAKTAYNEARSRAVWEVQDAWQRPVRRYAAPGEDVVVQAPVDEIGVEYIRNKLSRIMIPRIEFREATIREAIDYLRQKSRELDTTTEDPARRGVNIVLKIEPSLAVTTTTTTTVTAEPAVPGLEAPPPPPVPEAAAPIISPSEARITLSLSNVPLGTALDYVTELAGLKVKVEPYAVLVVPKSEPVDVLVTKEWKVPPGFITSAPGGAPAEPTGFAAARTGTAEAAPAMAGRANARQFLESQGVAFAPGAFAQFVPTSSRLIVRNTQENLDLIDTLVAAAQVEVPSQVEIEAKFVEITQNNLKELSFDWLLGQANIPGPNERVFFGGGTPGLNPIDPVDFPFVPPGGTPVGTFPVTAGTRSGSFGISANAIDALLFQIPGARQFAPAPGVLGISGVFTDPQFQLVIRALNQKKGVDLLSAPRVTAKSGQRAVIEIIREFRYPTEFDPPQIPQEFGSFSSAALTPGQTQNAPAFPVTPTTPTAFETRNTGVTLEVEPVVGPDGFTIDLNLVPQVVEFEGFINYGSPIQSSAVNALGQVQTVVLTPNVINQPIFSTRKVQTSVSIWDGHTVVLGGLMREDVQKVEDKVPVLGDLPFVGRAFRSSIDQHIKRNLIMFVTARLINPAGEPLHLEEEVEEVVELLAPPEITPPALPEMPLFQK